MCMYRLHQFYNYCIITLYIFNVGTLLAGQRYVAISASGQKAYVRRTVGQSTDGRPTTDGRPIDIWPTFTWLNEHRAELKFNQKCKKNKLLVPNLIKPNLTQPYFIIIIKKGRQCKAEREWYTPYQSEDPSPTIPNYRQKEEKGKKSRRLQ